MECNKILDIPALERYRGSLLGLAAGDALGAPVEGVPRTDLDSSPVQAMKGGGVWGDLLSPGQWTDDTSMALCLAESLIERKGFDPRDQLVRYRRWLREGHLSSKDHAFGIGWTVLGSLQRFEKTGDAFCGPSDPMTAGNGSIMRLAPVPLFYGQDSRHAVERSGESSRTTHQAPTAIDACRYLGGLIAGAVQGTGKEELLSERYCPIPADSGSGYWKEQPLVEEIDEIAAGSFKKKQPPDIRGTGYVVESLEAALWAFYRTDSFREGCLLAVNLGDDADTTGAVYGQLAGAFYGEGEIPGEWLQELARRELIESFAERLNKLSPPADFEPDRRT